jgi:hypothetical protein
MMWFGLKRAIEIIGASTKQSFSEPCTTSLGSTALVSPSPRTNVVAPWTSPSVTVASLACAGRAVARRASRRPTAALPAVVWRDRRRWWRPSPGAARAGSAPAGCAWSS